eukprot:7413495-Karenia_brevis.AAC.1
MTTSGVIKTNIHMCAYGMKSCDDGGEGLVYKPTGFATNSPCVAYELNKTCSKDHRHVHLTSGRAKHAQ